MHNYDCFSWVSCANFQRWSSVFLHVIPVYYMWQIFNLRYLNFIFSFSLSTKCLPDVQHKGLSASSSLMYCFSGTLKSKIGRVLIPACTSSSPAFIMLYSACKLNKQGDNIEPWCIPFPIWNQSIVPCPEYRTWMLPDLHTDFSRDR